MEDYKWQQLIPLREKNVEEYVPSIQQIIQYAQYIGLQFPGDEDLVYIAKQGINASLPDQWEACQTYDGQMVYRNKLTKTIQQEHPLDQHYRKKVLQIKQNQIQTYYNTQFDLRQTNQLPPIQQENNQFNQSFSSDNLQRTGLGINIKELSVPNKGKSKCQLMRQSSKQKDSFSPYDSQIQISLNQLNMNIQSCKKQGPSEEKYGSLEYFQTYNNNFLPSSLVQKESLNQYSRFSNQASQRKGSKKLSGKFRHKEKSCQYLKSKQMPYRNGTRSQVIIHNYGKWQDSNCIKQDQSNEKRDIKALVQELKRVEKQKQLKNMVLNQIVQSNRLKTLLIKEKLKTNTKKDKKHKNKQTFTNKNQIKSQNTRKSTLLKHQKSNQIQSKEKVNYNFKPTSHHYDFNQLVF